jgi:hypothetical protein
LASGQKQGEYQSRNPKKERIQRLVQVARHLVQFLNCRLGLSARTPIVQTVIYFRV